MRRLICAVLAVLAVAASVFTAGVGASAHRPPTTASLMPAYVAAAKYWLSRPLPRHVEHARAHA
jgi:hypothetical protein